MANEFKVAAERKRKMTETRKAQKIINQLEELLLEQGGRLSADDISAVQASVVRLKEVTEGLGVPSDVIMSVNEEAQKVFDAVTEKLGEEAPEEAVPEEVPEATAEETGEEDSLAEEEAQEPEPEQEAPAKEEKQEENEPEEGFSEEKIADILRRMYKAPRYSRVENETRARFNALIKPSLRKLMEEDRKAGRIKSPNDLINGLLEIYYGDE